MILILSDPVFFSDLRGHCVLSEKLLPALLAITTLPTWQ